MNIDFPPPSNGVYNNAGSSRQLANYLEHEDMERMEQGIYTEGFFKLNQDNLYKSQVIKDIDSNIGQLLKTDAKFYAIHVSPSEKELQAMGSTEQEQAEAMKRYTREVFIPEYAKNFNKGLSAENIKFYGKIHFNRDRSENKLNMHCHLIVSRKDQSNKIKINPLTNHRNTKKGVITGGFDRVALFENVEKGFDKLFGYNRQLVETFEYCNTMKNGNVTDKLKIQEQEITHANMPAGEKKNNPAHKPSDVQIGKQESTFEQNQSLNQEHKYLDNQSNTPDGISSLFSVLPSAVDISQSDEPPQTKPKKKKKPRRRIS
ncbi:hypothetical protein EZS27_014480 [termite gut metagenome]|uniref:Clindamycin resistance transfer factor BtgB n=1 Tax=termite gut metagenome TaxID=433724 RepID=A0A5J4RV28_9ZZZZ